MSNFVIARFAIFNQEEHVRSRRVHYCPCWRAQLLIKQHGCIDMKNQATWMHGYENLNLHFHFARVGNRIISYSVARGTMSHLYDLAADVTVCIKSAKTKRRMRMVMCSRNICFHYPFYIVHERVISPNYITKRQPSPLFVWKTVTGDSAKGILLYPPGVWLYE